jgi:iron-sulfur cluster repair protein YtfE (RIC family)
MKSITRRSATALISATVLAPLAKASAQTQLPGGASDVLALLEHEHRAALALIDRIIGTSDAGQRERLLRQLADALTIHNANEENIIYPAVRDAAHKPADAAELYHQQDESKVVIAQLIATPKDGAAFVEGVKKLRVALAAHIHQEETVDFPAIRDALGSKLAQLDTMSAQLRAHWVANPST